MIETATNIKKIGTSLKAARDIFHPKYFSTRDNQQLCVRGANNVEAERVEELIRQCAESGDGFNIDEFCPEDGHFLHKFIHQPRVIVATDIQDEIRGAAIFGFSELSRFPGSLFGAYFVVREGDRRKGIGGELLKTVEEFCQQENCDTLFFDVFTNNHAGILFLKKYQFLVTGCIPQCGYVVNHGFTDSLLMFKRIAEKNISGLVAKI